MLDSPAASSIYQIAKQLRFGGIFERSVKIAAIGVSKDRGLASLPIQVLGKDRRTSLKKLASQIGIEDVSPLDMHLDRAVSLHLGADEGIRKIYLEFAPDSAPESGLVFLALKVKEGRGALNRYRNITPLSHAEKLALLRQHISDADAFGAAKAVLDLARAGDPDDEAVVLEVSEESSQRLSFDISVADAGRSVASLKSVLGSLIPDWGLVPPDAHDSLLGHVAIGQDASGAAFVTLYYGARGL